MPVGTNKTPEPVIFRVWKSKPGGVIALFPAWDYGQSMVGSYEHVGQHGGADYRGVISKTRPATEMEYSDLKRELENLPDPHVLQVLKRRPAGMQAVA